LAISTYNALNKFRLYAIISILNFKLMTTGQLLNGHQMIINDHPITNANQGLKVSKQLIVINN
jgi:hypothetical protein